MDAAVLDKWAIGEGGWRGAWGQNIKQIHELIIFLRPDFDSGEFRSLGLDNFSVKVGSNLENLHFPTHKLAQKSPKIFFFSKKSFFLLMVLLYRFRRLIMFRMVI